MCEVPSKNNVNVKKRVYSKCYNKFDMNIIAYFKESSNLCVSVNEGCIIY